MESADSSLFIRPAVSAPRQITLRLNVLWSLIHPLVVLQQPTKHSFETMRRVKAEQSYFFDPTYFSDLAKSLGRALKLFVVRMPDGEVISGGLFTLCEGIVQYHLGGTRDTALKLSPMVLLLDTCMALGE